MPLDKLMLYWCSPKQKYIVNVQFHRVFDHKFWQENKKLYLLFSLNKLLQEIWLSGVTRSKTNDFKIYAKITLGNPWQPIPSFFKPLKIGKNFELLCVSFLLFFVFHSKSVTTAPTVSPAKQTASLVFLICFVFMYY